MWFCFRGMKLVPGKAAEGLGLWSPLGLLTNQTSYENWMQIFNFYRIYCEISLVILLLRYPSTFTKEMSVSVKPSFGLIVLQYVPPEEVGGVGGARAIIKGPKPWLLLLAGCNSSSNLHPQKLCLPASYKSKKLTEHVKTGTILHHKIVT